MNDIKELYCKDFENEKWLYAEESLPKKRMEFWNGHLQQCNTCASIIKNEEEILIQIKDELSEDVLDWKYELMLKEAVSKNKKFTFGYLWKLNDVFAVKTKVALISGLAVVAILISLITPKQNPVKTVSSELLDWEGKKVNSQIENIEQKIEIISSDKWSNEIRSIDEQLQKLEIHVDKF